MKHLQVVKGGEVLGMGLADYVWLDDEGSLSWKKYVVPIVRDERGDPAPLLRRKTFSYCDCEPESEWDGCGCGEDDEGELQTLVLVPCHYLPDPTRPQPNFIVLCHVKDVNDQPVEWNERAKLVKVMRKQGDDAKMTWFGFRQDYALYDARGEGADASDIEERRFFTAERHLGACFDAGLLIQSMQSYPGTTHYDFKVGPRGIPSDKHEPPNALVVADHVIIARYLMEKIGGGKGLVPRWCDLSVYLSTGTLRGVGPQAKIEAEAERLENGLTYKGRLRRLPHPERGGIVCIVVGRDEPEDPYKLAAGVLKAIGPFEDEEEQDAEESGGGGGADRVGEDDPEP